MGSIVKTTDQICLICLKKSKITTGNEKADSEYRNRVLLPNLVNSTVPLGEESESSKKHGLYTRLLHFIVRHLKLTAVTKPLLDISKEYESREGPGPFCPNCRSLISYICDLFAEFEIVKMHMAWKVTELGNVMRSSGRNVPSSRNSRRVVIQTLASQLGLRNTGKVDSFRTALKTKCVNSSKNHLPRAIIPRGLIQGKIIVVKLMGQSIKSSITVTDFCHFGDIFQIVGSFRIQRQKQL